MEKKVLELKEELRSRDLKAVKSALKKAEKLVAGGFYSDDLIEVLTSLFFKDVYEYPEWRENVEYSAEIIGKAGKKSIPKLLNLSESSDAKAAFYFALSIGKIGIDCLDPVIQKLLKTESGYLKAVLIFALGKIKDKQMKRAIPDILPYLNDTDAEVRDSAARTLGKIFEVIKPNDISEKETVLVFEKLMELIKDQSPKIRTKALHSIGKLLKGGFLPNSQVARFEGVVLKILGKDGISNWDDAYIVRREAEELLLTIKEYLKK